MPECASSIEREQERKRKQRKEKTEGQFWNYTAPEMSKCWFLHVGLHASCLVRVSCERMCASVSTDEAHLHHEGASGCPGEG